MYCKQCGSELVGVEMYCDACGAPVKAVAGGKSDARTRAVASDDGAAAGTTTGTTAGTAAGATNDVQGAYLSYEYARRTVGDDMAQACVDCYESLGYELTGQRAVAPGGRQSTLSFRRSRKVAGKAQLAKIKRTMDDTLTSIANLESQKTKKASVQALSLGVLFALVLGVGMCCTMVWQGLMVPGVIVGIVGIAGCVGAYVRYRTVCAAETARLNPEIEAAYDRLATLCEEAQAVLRGQAARSNA